MNSAPQPRPLARWELTAVSGAANMPTGGRLLGVQAAAGSADGLAVFSTLADGSNTAQVLSLAPAALNGGLAPETAAPTALSLTGSALPALTASIALRTSPAPGFGLVAFGPNSNQLQVQKMAPQSFWLVNAAENYIDIEQSDSVCDIDRATPGEQCSLAAAIFNANKLGVPATIAFGIGSGGPQKINFVNMQVVTVPLTIDGTTQTGYTGTPIIELSGEQQTTSAGLAFFSPVTLRGLVINNFPYNALYFTGGASGSIIENNYIGTDPGGTLAKPNGRLNNYPAVAILNSAQHIKIGGTHSLEGVLVSGNLISGNKGAGIAVLDNASATLIEGNYIGTNFLGTEPLGNGWEGIAISCDSSLAAAGHGNTVGGQVATHSNVISANQRAGVAIACTNAYGNLVQGNYIGTDYHGNLPVGDLTSSVGVVLYSAGSGIVYDNQIGGSIPEARNIIAGNTYDGVLVGADVSVAGLFATQNIIAGNFIGTGNPNFGSLASIPNGYNGIILRAGAVNNLIGGIRAISNECDAPCNLISGNTENGILISGAINNRIRGNTIGMDAAGGAPQPNKLAGIRIEKAGTNNLIGGDRAFGPCQDTCNLIAGNTEEGIIVLDSASLNNTIRGNDIHDNGKLGINLSGGKERPNGVTANSDAVFPIRPNDLVYFPVGVMAAPDGTGKTFIGGVLASKNPQNATIDLYASSKVDSSGHGQGEVYLGQVKPSASGVFQFYYGGPLPKLFVSATATDASGSTSEFSPVCGDPDGDGSIDTDGDSLCDDWETKGIDFNADGTTDLDLSTLGARPTIKNIFIEADYMRNFKPPR